MICGVSTAALAGLALFGCDGLTGGGGSGHGSSPSSRDARTEIEQVLTRTSTVGDPAQCTEDMTPAFLRQNFGSDGDQVERCRRENRDARTPEAESIQINTLTVNGGSARAEFKISGGSGDGSVVRVDLVLDADRWKLDRLSDIQIDRARYDAAQRADLIASGLGAREASCAISAVDRRYDTPALERASVQGHDAMQQALASAVIPCLSRATLVRQVRKGLTRGLSAHGVPAPVTNCIEDRVLNRLGTGQLRAVSTSDPMAVAHLKAEVQSAAVNCGREYRSGALGSVS